MFPTLNQILCWLNEHSAITLIADLILVDDIHFPLSGEYYHHLNQLHDYCGFTVRFESEDVLA